MLVEEIDNACELCIQENCDGCEFQDVHFRNTPWYKSHKYDMKRHEQRLQAADQYADPGSTGDVPKSFLAGAEWADKHPDPELLNKFITRAAKWLVSHDVMSESFANTFKHAMSHD